MKDRRLVVGAAFLFVIGNGVAYQVRGPLLSEFQAAFDVPPSLLGLVAPAGTAGFLAVVLAVGFAAGRIDLRHALLAGAGGVAVCLVLVAAAPAYPLLLLALVGQGAAGGFFRSADRPVLSHLYPDGRARIFNLYELAWALGAVAGPVFVVGVLSVADWRAVYVLLALSPLAVALLLWRADLPADVEAEEDLSLSALRALLSRPAVVGMVTSMALVGGIEGVFFTWLPFYAETLGYVAESVARVSLSAFLLAYVVGRAAYSAVADRTPYLPLMAAVSAASIPVLYVTFGGLGSLPTPALLGMVFVSGVLVSGMFPTLMAFGVDAAPEHSGPINAVGIGANSLGIAVVSAVVGVVVDTVGVGAGVRLSAAVALAQLVVILLTRATADPEIGTDPDPAD